MSFTLKWPTKNSVKSMSQNNNFVYHI